VTDWVELADRLGVAAVADGAPTRWFEELWSAADRGEVGTPWNRSAPHWALAEWADGTDGTGRRAVVVGAGLGADAEHLSTLGFATTAFDISATAVRTARDRHPGTAVDYRVADLLGLPADLVGTFELVVEIFTVQALPRSVRSRAMAGVRGLVAPGGTLLVVQAVREDDEPVGAAPPWLLDRAEMTAFAGDGLVLDFLHRLPHPTPAGRPAWRAVLTRRT
jgi:hypothetical protein